MTKEWLALKEAYEQYFYIGAAVNPSNLEKDAELLSIHFNSLTAENHMKPEELQPEKGSYTFETADKIVDFAKENGQKMRGHTLVWHNQTPKWMFQSEDGKPLGREQALEQLKEHIRTVVTRYKEPFYAWDVVNEAVADSGKDILRDSPWLSVVGEDYIDQAFHFAHEVNPTASLFYNDYNESDPDKRDKIVSLVKGLKEREVPIHGVGLQAHWGLEDPTLDQIREAIERYAALDTNLHITEMDVSMFAFDDKRKDVKEPSEDMLKSQAERYEQFFELFREYQNEIESVTLWGVSDRYTWLSDFPVQGRKNWPLLFDEKNQPKESFKKIAHWKYPEERGNDC